MSECLLRKCKQQFVNMHAQNDRRRNISSGSSHRQQTADATPPLRSVIAPQWKWPYFHAQPTLIEYNVTRYHQRHTAPSCYIIDIIFCNVLKQVCTVNTAQPDKITACRSHCRPQKQRGACPQRTAYHDVCHLVRRVTEKLPRNYVLLYDDSNRSLIVKLKAADSDYCHNIT